MRQIREVEPAEHQELPVMAEASQTASLGDSRQSIDRFDAWNTANAFVISAVSKEIIGRALDLAALPNQAPGVGVIIWNMRMARAPGGNCRPIVREQPLL